MSFLFYISGNNISLIRDAAVKHPFEVLWFADMQNDMELMNMSAELALEIRVKDWPNLNDPLYNRWVRLTFKWLICIF